MPPGPASSGDDDDDLLEDAPCGLLSIRPDGTIVRANRTFASMLNRQAPFAGARFDELLTAPSRFLYQSHVQTMLMTLGAASETALRFQRQPEPPFSALVNFVARRNANGTPGLVRAAVFLNEKSAVSEQEHRQADSKARQLFAVVSASSDAIISYGLDLEILSWNAGAVRLFGFGEDKAVGCRADELHIPPSELGRVRQNVSALIRGQAIAPFEAKRRHKDGHTVDVEINAAPILDTRGNVIAIATIMRDIGERLRATNDLHASRTALQAALDVANMASWQWDERNQRELWSDKALSIFGLPPQTEMTKTLFAALLHPEDTTALRSAWAAAMEPDGQRTFKLDYRIRRADNGATRLISSKAVVEFEDDAPARVFGALRDITEEHAAQERIGVLLHEVNHRSKNLLSVVQLIAEQTIKHHDFASFISRFAERLQALSANQDLLLRNYCGGANMMQIVRSQLSPFEDFLDGRIRLEGPTLEVRAEAAEAIGMALHELVTNAAKYGALSNDVGMVRICWSLSDAGRPSLQLSWSERDGPPVQPPTRHGFGQVVLRQLVASAVKGTTELVHAPEGVSWTLQAPLADAF